MVMITHVTEEVTHTKLMLQLATCRECHGSMSIFLANGWRARNLNRPVRIQQARKSALSGLQCTLTRTGIEVEQLFSLETTLNI